METEREVLDWVREQGVVALAAHPGVPSLVEQIAGPVHGSWWGHPRGKLIYALATSLEESGEVEVLKLIAGKAAFVHARLWPAVSRIAADPARRAAAMAALSPAARKLLAAVDAQRELRLDLLEPRPPAKARQELEKGLLCGGRSLHTERGHHASVLQGWDRFFAPDVRRAAAGLSLDAALAAFSPSVRALLPTGKEGLTVSPKASPRRHGQTRKKL